SIAECRFQFRASGKPCCDGTSSHCWAVPRRGRSRRAQQPTMPVIGYLHVGSSAESRDRVAAFHRGLKELGFVEGRNVSIEYRWADNQNDQVPELAADLIRRGVAVIAAPAGADTTRVIKGLTTTIPIVFSTEWTRSKRAWSEA